MRAPFDPNAFIYHFIVFGHNMGTNVCLSTVFATIWKQLRKIIATQNAETDRCTLEFWQKTVSVAEFDEKIVRKSQKIGIFL